MRSIIRIRKVIENNQLKRKVCDSCVKRLKGILPDEQIRNSEQAFYGASEGYLFSENKE